MYFLSYNEIFVCGFVVVEFCIFKVDKYLLVNWNFWLGFKNNFRKNNGNIY